MASGTYDKAAQSIASSFESKTGDKINIVTSPWADLNQQNITDLSTQTGQFDVISGEWWISSVFQHMLPLDDYVKRDNFGSDYIPNLFQPGPSNFYQGKRISVPYSADAVAVLFNKELFQTAGVTPEWKTWDDFISVMDSLKAKLPSGVSPHAFAFGAPEQPGSLFLGAYDGTLIATDNTYKVERDKATTALNTVKKLAQYGPSNVLALSIDEATAVFLQGKSAVLLGWPSFIRTQADKPATSQIVGKWQQGTFPAPGFPLLSCWNLFISKYSKNPDADWEWIKAYANPQNGKDFMVNFGVGSPFKSTYADQALVQAHSHDFPAQLQNLGKAKPVPYPFEAWELLYRNLGDFLAGSATADQVIDRWHQGWADIKPPDALIESAIGQGLKAK
jgi:maltose-binding protein MalE